MEVRAPRSSFKLAERSAIGERGILTDRPSSNELPSRVDLRALRGARGVDSAGARPAGIDRLDAKGTPR